LQRLKLKYDKRVSNVAFNFKLRRYVTVLNATHLTFTRTPARPAAHLTGQAGGLLRPSTRLTLNLLTSPARLYEHSL
jgi:hypothetical protein